MRELTILPKQSLSWMYVFAVPGIFLLFLFLINFSTTHNSSELEAELPWPIIKYPRGYGVEKYLQRKATILTNPSCINKFSHSSAMEIANKLDKELGKSKNSSIKYVQGKETFGGNLDIEGRKRYFSLNNPQNVEISCGFSNKNHGSSFIVSKCDREAMERRRGLVVVSAIFGTYDKVRQPRNVKRITKDKACFIMFLDHQTLQDLQNHKGIKYENKYLIDNSRNDCGGGGLMLGLWRLVVVEEVPYGESVMNGLIPKYLIHRLFPNCKYSLWVDAKLQLVVDPLVLLDSLLVRKNADMAVSAHPYNKDAMEEAMFTVRWGKWDKYQVRFQMESYCSDGFQPWSTLKHPYTTDVPDTAIILRRHGLESDLFSCLMFNEIQVFNPRDQLAFAFVRDNMKTDRKIRINMFDSEIFEAVTNEYRHAKRVPKPSPQENHDQEKKNKGAFISFQESPCKPYIESMLKSKYS